jgi:hypothetical protein
LTTREIISFCPMWTFHIYIYINTPEVLAYGVYISQFDTIFQGWHFLWECPWLRIAANKEATEPSVPSGNVEFMNSSCRMYYRISISEITTNVFHIS